MSDEELSNLIKRNADRYKASAQLRAAVRTQITLYAAGQRPEATGRVGLIAHLRHWVGWRGTAAHAKVNLSAAQLSVGFVSGVLLTLVVVLIMPRKLPNDAVQEPMVADVLSLHVRSLGAGPLFQVASSDRHTVKPWFQGKVDYAPEVPDLRDAGFELLGGRVDKLQRGNTAALAFQLRKHIISAYVSPMELKVPVERLQRRGFNMIHWSDGIMQVWAITDADASELDRFAYAWRSKF